MHHLYGCRRRLHGGPEHRANRETTEKVAYEEMLELASLGAKVLQSRSVEFAARYGVPVEVQSSFKEGQGTLVAKEDADMERVMVAGVTGDRNRAQTRSWACRIVRELRREFSVPWPRRIFWST